MMYFGTRERALWVAAPAPGAGFAAEGYSSKMQYSNGGGSVRNSKGAHLEYDFSWGSLTRDQIAEIEDYAYGLYGDGLVYPLDPYAMDRNAFNAQWAAPKITAEDGIPLTGTERPDRTLVGDLSLGYPMYGATYTVTAGQEARKFYVPVPLGYTAWVGAHGVANAKGLIVQPTNNGLASGAPTSLALLGVNSTTRFNGSFVAGSYNGIEVSLDTSTAGARTYAGLMCQVLENGVTPQDGGFISGRGNSGCEFLGKPTRQVYSLPGESIGLSAKMIEVGDWL